MKDFLLTVLGVVAITACIVLGMYCMDSINGELGKFVGTTVITLPIWATFIVTSLPTKK
jgi:hypothetical protein